jgi:hypothetical protein
VDLANAAASFEVEGLTIVGTAFSGTPGPITAVTGTLVCNAGTNSQVALDTASVPLNVRGDAHFSGHIHNIPATCNNPLFLVPNRESGRRGWLLDCHGNRALHRRRRQVSFITFQVGEAPLASPFFLYRAAGRLNGMTTWV